VVLRDPRCRRRARRARALHANNEPGWRGQDESDENDQEGDADDSRFRRLVGRRVQNNEGQQERDKQDKGWAKPAVSHSVFEHLAEPNHGSGW
jgi:hypothetical protein